MKPRRSILSVPGHLEKMHVKALGSGADVIMLDLEDSVPITEKETARNLMIKSISQNDWTGKIFNVRTNSTETPFG